MACTKPDDSDNTPPSPPPIDVPEYTLSIDRNTKDNFYVGEKINFNVKYKSGNNLLDFDKDITWTCDYPTCVVIDNDTDTITPIALPSEVSSGASNYITFTGTHNEKSKVEYKVLVYYVNKTFKLTIQDDVETLTVGETVSADKIFKQAVGAFITNMPITLTTSDADVIGIDNDVLIAKRAGTAKITAKVNYKSTDYNAETDLTSDVSIVFNVNSNNLVIPDDDTDNISVSSVKLEHNGQELDKNQVYFTCLDENIATINTLGEVSGIKQGVTEIFPKINYDGQIYTGSAIRVSVYDDEKAITTPDFANHVKTENTEYIDWNGRIKFTANGNRFYHNSTGFTITFVGTKVNIGVDNVDCAPEATPGVRVYVDGVDVGPYRPDGLYSAVKNLEYGLHTVRVLKTNSSWTNGQLNGLSFANCSTDGVFVPTEKRTLRFEFFGDSITAGYGCGQPDFPQYNTANFYNEDGTKTYAQYTADYFNANSSIIASSGWTVAYDQPTWKSMVPRYFESFYMHTDIKNKVPSVLEDNLYDVSKNKPDVVVINLATNDLNNTILAESFNGNTQNRDDAFVNGYKTFLTTIRNAYPNAKIICANGLMGDKGAPLIQRAISELHFTNIYQVTLPINTAGLGSHPNEAGNQNGAKTLIDFIIDNGIVADPNA
jgi:lysophospholipase L1-like esterase